MFYNCFILILESKTSIYISYYHALRINIAYSCHLSISLFSQYFTYLLTVFLHEYNNILLTLSVQKKNTLSLHLCHWTLYFGHRCSGSNQTAMITMTTYYSMSSLRLKWLAHLPSASVHSTQCCCRRHCTVTALLKSN